MPETSSLVDKRCEKCTPNTPRLSWVKRKKLLAEVPLWQFVQTAYGGTLVRHFRFEKYSQVQVFVSEVWAIAETEGHHPNINVDGFNQVLLTLTTHAIHDLSENDFIVAAKIDRIS